MRRNFLRLFIKYGTAYALKYIATHVDNPLLRNVLIIGIIGASIYVGNKGTFDNIVLGDVIVKSSAIVNEYFNTSTAISLKEELKEFEEDKEKQLEFMIELENLESELLPTGISEANAVMLEESRPIIVEPIDAIESRIYNLELLEKINDVLASLVSVEHLKYI